MSNSPRSLTRREAIQRIAAAVAAMALMDSSVSAVPYTGDPNLHTKAVTWDRILSEDELKIVTLLADTIIPADDKSPAASAVGVPDFINEWVSAPYPNQVDDLAQIRYGLTWLDTEAQKRFQKKFTALDETQVHAICDDICYASKAKPEFKKPAGFFSKFRTLVAGGFYSTPEGWADLGYIGNKPLAEFPGPPPEVLKHMGLSEADTQV